METSGAPCHPLSSHAAGAPAQSPGDRGPGSREDLHHKALRAPGVLPALPGHHRGGLRPQGAQLGPQDGGAAAAVGHRRCVQVIVCYVCQKNTPHTLSAESNMTLFVHCLQGNYV